MLIMSRRTLRAVLWLCVWGSSRPECRARTSALAVHEHGSRRAAAAPAIAVLTPTSRTQWDIGSAQVVKWSKDPTVTDVSVYLLATHKEAMDMTATREVRLSTSSPYTSLTFLPRPYLSPVLVRDGEHLRDFAFFIRIDADQQDATTTSPAFIMFDAGYTDTGQGLGLGPLFRNNAGIMVFVILLPIIAAGVYVWRRRLRGLDIFGSSGKPHALAPAYPIHEAAALRLLTPRPASPPVHHDGDDVIEAIIVPESTRAAAAAGGGGGGGGGGSGGRGLLQRRFSRLIAAKDAEAVAAMSPSAWTFAQTARASGAAGVFFFGGGGGGGAHGGGAHGETPSPPPQHALTSIDLEEGQRLDRIHSR
ncbi:hypothetical protein JKP88DRAFT_251437 [Tribonema minus]|uniref:Uncharacterized protein n=1 Tax=Tribonema minus TaxID=303371 RepID=A0A836CNB2_9STRA|nr:hypothetical protein JKP88DRAFT_251437 [Tribonema minus]